MERSMGIEPTSRAWEAPILPLNYARSFATIAHPICADNGPSEPAGERGGQLNSKSQSMMDHSKYGFEIFKILSFGSSYTVGSFFVAAAGVNSTSTLI